MKNIDIQILKADLAVHSKRANSSYSADLAHRALETINELEVKANIQVHEFSEEDITDISNFLTNDVQFHRSDKPTLSIVDSEKS